MSKRKRHCSPMNSQRRSHSTHHMLFQKRFWNSGYAHALRENPYFKIVVPNDFHRKLHERLYGVKPPLGKDCHKTYQELIARLNDGLLTLQDSPEVRLQFLIDEWLELYPAIVKELEKQQAIFRELAGKNAKTNQKKDKSEKQS